MADMAGLHVVIVPAWWPSPEQPMSGVFFADYAAAYAVAGARVGVIFPDLVSLRYLGSGADKPWLPRLSRESSGGIPVVRIRGLHWAFGRPWMQMRTYRRWLRRGLAAYTARYGAPDILHAMCAIPAGWACTHLGEPLERRVVVTEHTGPFALALTPPSARPYVFAALNRAAAVVAVSEPLRQEMTSSGIARDICVCSNPVAADFAPAPPPPVEDDRAGRRTFHAFFAGRFTDLKGVPELIDAAVALSSHARLSIHWHFAGYGPLENTLQRRFAAAGIADRLTMHGLCDRPAVARLLQQAHFLVLPSHGENCPLAIGEALTSGRPVVASTAAGCRAILTDADGVLAPIGDAAGLADAIVRLLTSYERWAWQDIAARARARFSAEAIAARYAGIYELVRPCKSGKMPL